MSSLRIVATILAKEEAATEIRETLIRLVTASRTEAGNISYVLCQDLKKENLFTVLEEWKSQEAIDFHNNTPHFREFLRAIAGKTEDVQISVMKPIV